MTVEGSMLATQHSTSTSTSTPDLDLFLEIASSFLLAMTGVASVSCILNPEY